MRKTKPLSVYFSSQEREMLAEIADHCKRSESDQVRFIVEEKHQQIFSDTRGSGQHAKR